MLLLDIFDDEGDQGRLSGRRGPVFTSVNLRSRTESAIGPAGGDRDGGGGAGEPGAAGRFELRSLFSSSTLWKVLTALAASVLLAEWLLFHRRSTE